jgi:predicted CXXCH cytochrome family protein
MGMHRPDPSAPHSLPRYRRGTARVSVCHSAFVVTTTAVAILITAACSRESRHQVLVYLYDGVPPLDADRMEPASGPEEEGTTQAAGADPSVAKPKKDIYTHPHYWENRCGSCHNAGGRLLRPVREGLCSSCHFQKPSEKKKHLHGPAATNDCLVCHRYHRSKYEKILVADAQTLCSYCHTTEELTQDKHHKTMDKERCVACHDPHGGDDRFFLLPGVVPAGPSQDELIIERSQ